MVSGCWERFFPCSKLTQFFGNYEGESKPFGYQNFMKSKQRIARITRIILS